MLGAAFQLLDLETLNLGGNKIEEIKHIIYGYPKVQDISLKGNPLYRIVHNAFRECVDLQTLDIENIKLRNVRGDINFLKGRNNLTTLKMSNCFVDKDFHDINIIPELQNLERLVIREVGLLHLTDISFKFPMIEVLDLQDNKIFELQAIEDLKLLTYLVELNLLDNPLVIHKSLHDDILEAIPMIEVLNNKILNDAGAKYKIETRKLQKELDEWDSNRPTGFQESDEILADAIEDPTFKLDQIIAKYKLDPEEDEEEESKLNKLVKKNELISTKDKANRKITEKKISDFEKVQHMRVKMLNEESKEPEDGFNGYLLMKDLNTYQEKIQQDFHDTKVKFRSVYNDLRT